MNEFDNSPLQSCWHPSPLLRHCFQLPLPISFSPCAGNSTKEERVDSPNNLGDTTIPVDSDGLYKEIVTHFWHPDLAKVFELEVVTGKMSLVAEVERDSDKVFQIRVGGGRAGQTNELACMNWDIQKRCVRFFFGFVFMPFWPD